MNLRHHLLLAMPQMADSSFANSLIYICEHDELGALGLVINRPLELDLGEVFQQMNIVPESDANIHQPVFEGGPVDQTHGLILHQSTNPQQWENTRDYEQQLCLTSSRDILQDIAIGKGPDAYTVFLGHAGWGPGQLENELSENCWLSCPAETDIIFSTPPEKRLEQAAQLLGINLSQLSSQIGHA